MAITIADIILYGIKIIHHSRRHLASRVGIYHTILLSLHLSPFERGRINAPTIILRSERLGGKNTTEYQYNSYYKSSHLHIYIYNSDKVTKKMPNAQ
jgi:hypothetical protein